MSERVSVLNPGRRQRRDFMDTILKGLDIASKFYGISADREKLEIIRDENNQKKRRNSGFLTVPDLIETSKTHDISRNKPEGDSIELRDYKGALYATVRQKPEKPVPVTTLDKDGKKVKIFHAPKAGDTFPAPSNELADAIKGSITQKEIRDSTIKLGKDSDGFRDRAGAIKNVEKDLGFSLDDYDDKKGTVHGKPIDIPGISLKLIGRVDFLTGEARDLKASIKKIFNEELLRRSGGAVTPKEMSNLLDEFSMGKFNTEEELVKALKRYKDLAREHLKDIEARYDPEVVKNFKNNGGFTSEQFLSGKRKGEGKLKSSPKSSDGIDDPDDLFLTHDGFIIKRKDIKPGTPAKKPDPVKVIEEMKRRGLPVPDIKNEIRKKSL